MLDGIIYLGQIHHFSIIEGSSSTSCVIENTPALHCSNSLHFDPVPLPFKTMIDGTVSLGQVHFLFNMNMESSVKGYLYSRRYSILFEQLHFR